MNENIPYDVRFPILVPKGATPTRMIMLREHERTKHIGGADQTLLGFTRKFFTPRARELARKVVRECNYCRRYDARPAQQRMGPLPDFRLDHGGEMVAFSTTGVDACGPFEVQRGRGRVREKRWIILFTCAQIRAVHVELVSGMDVDAFMMAYARFTARRGTPNRICSDNGTNFTGTAAALKMALRARGHEIEWLFQPPASPHRGGFFERMIRSLKGALVKLLPAGTVTSAELETLAITAEGFINDRPVTYVSGQADEMLPITPAMFLGRGALVQPQGGGSDGPTALGARWNNVQGMTERLWRGLIHRLAPQHLALQKWKGETRNLTVGDVVVLLEERSRGRWPIAIVTGAFKGRDRRVRTVEIRQVNGKIKKRSVVRLALLVPAGTEEI